MSTISKKSANCEASVSPPLLYYRTDEQIAAYRQMPVEDKLHRLEMMAEFFQATMSNKAKKIRDDFMQKSR